MKNSLDIGINVNSLSSLFFSKHLKYLKQEKKKKKIIRTYDLSCKEYIRISQILSKIPNSFYLYEKVEFIQPTEIQEDFIEKRKDLLDNKYVLFTYTLSENYISFQTFLKKLGSPSLFFSTLMDTYSHLLNSLYRLSLMENKICLLSISSSNLFFRKDFNAPFFTLEEAFFLPKTITPFFMEQTMNKIIKLKNFSFQPMEIHLLYFLYKNQSSFLSISDLIEVIHYYIISMPFFSFFTKEEKEKYKDSCMESMKNLVSLNFSSIFILIMKEYSFTWDNFALSMFFFYILEKINNVFPSQEFAFFKEWSTLLLKNIGADPGKRETVENTKKVFEKLFINYPHWLFIQEIDQEKISLLFKTLE